jgi:hypothetical protein
VRRSARSPRVSENPIDRQPQRHHINRRAAAATSIFFMPIMASNARFA